MIEIELIQEDIDIANKLIKERPSNRAGFCPIANALRRKYPGEDIIVAFSQLRIGRSYFEMDCIGCRIRKNYDTHLLIRPTKFTINCIDQSTTSIM